MDKATLERQIGDAIGAHGSWKLKLRRAVATGELPKRASDISCDDQCSFGKWLHGMGKDGPEGAGTYFKSVVEAHAAFHREAGRIARLVETGKRKEAETALDGPAYVTATTTLTRTMNAWRDSV